jgi:hypothetical protein
MSTIPVIKTTQKELLDAGFSRAAIKSQKDAQKRILAAGTKNALIERAKKNSKAKVPKGTIPRRGLWFELVKILGADDKKTATLIMDALDPSWPLFPSPMELKDNFRYAEIHGHLSLIRASTEAYVSPFSSDKKTQSHFLLFDRPFAHASDKEKYNSGKNSDEINYATFPIFHKFNDLDNGPALDRFGFFVTKTATWVGKGDEYGDLHPLHAWAGWLSTTPEKTYQLIIFDPNNERPAGATVHYSELLPGQRNFIKECLKGWGKLRKDKVFLANNPNGNPKGRCLEITSAWIQKLVAEESWKHFPFPEQFILGFCCRVNMSDTGRKTPSPRNSSPSSLEPRVTRSRSVSRSPSDSSSDRSRSASPAAGPSRTVYRSRSRLNLVSTAGSDDDNPVGNVTVHTADAEHESIEDDGPDQQLWHESGLDMENLDLGSAANNDDPALPVMELTELPTITVPVSAPTVTDPEEEIEDIGGGSDQFADALSTLLEDVLDAPTPRHSPLHSSVITAVLANPPADHPVTPEPSTVLEAPTPPPPTYTPPPVAGPSVPGPSVPSPSLAPDDTEVSRLSFDLQKHLAERDARLAIEKAEKKEQERIRKEARRAEKERKAEMERRRDV